MKKINNKGFLLSETLISTCIIAVLATSLYVYVSKVISNYEKRDNYDNVVDVYKLSNYKVFFENYEKTNTEYNDYMNINYKPEPNTCTHQIEGWDMDILYEFSGMDKGPTDLIICRGNGFKDYIYNNNNNEDAFKYPFSDGFLEYVRLLPTSDIKDDEYIIIAEFSGSQERKTSYASIKADIK